MSDTKLNRVVGRRKLASVGDDSAVPMKKGCQTKTLDQISINLDSRRVRITKAVREEGQYPYYGASGIVDYVHDYIFDE